MTTFSYFTEMHLINLVNSLAAHHELKTNTSKRCSSRLQSLYVAYQRTLLSFYMRVLQRFVFIAQWNVYSGKYTES